MSQDGGTREGDEVGHGESIRHGAVTRAAGP